MMGSGGRPGNCVVISGLCVCMSVWKVCGGCGNL